MTRSSVARSLLALVVLLGTASQAGAEICLGLSVRFEGRDPAALLVATMTSEVASIWAPYDVRIVPLGARRDTTCRTLHGSFEVTVERQPPPREPERGVVLGRTHLPRHGIDNSPIRIDYDATERILGMVPVSRLATLAGDPVLGSRDLGRALGRVLAHEIGHILLAAPYHQRNGLMRARYFSDDLVDLRRSTFTLSPVEVARLRSRERVLHAIAIAPAS